MRRKSHYEKYYWRDTEGFIYFAASVLTPFVKIGFALDVDHRMKQLRRQYRLPDLTPVAVFDGTPSQERRIHSVLSHYRVVGEWFLPVGHCLDALRGFIA